MGWRCQRWVLAPKGSLIAALVGLAPRDVAVGGEEFEDGGESRHNVLPSRAVDVAFLLADGSVSWSGLLLAKFARLVKAADARVRWGGDWPGFKDRPHFEV